MFIKKWEIKVISKKEINSAHALSLLISADVIEEFVRVLLYPSHFTNSVFISIINIFLYCVAFMILSCNCVSEGRIFLKKDSIVISFCVIAFLTVATVITFIVNPNIVILGKNALLTLAISILFFLFGMVEIDINTFYNDMIKISIVAIIYGILAGVKYNIAEVYLNICYNILPFLLISFYVAKKTKSLYARICFLIITYMLIISGGRMPLLIVLSFILGIYFFKEKCNVRKLQIVIILSAIGLIGLLALDQIGLIRSRSLRMLAQGQFLVAGGRDILYRVLLDEVRSNPFKIRGLYADRFGLEEMAKANIITLHSAPYTSFAHNAFVEILYDFGFLIGGVLCAFLLSTIFRFLRRVFWGNNDDSRSLYLIWFLIGFFPLLVSGSFLLKNPFWIFLAMGLRRNSSISENNGVS